MKRDCDGLMLKSNIFSFLDYLEAKSGTKNSEITFFCIILSISRSFTFVIIFYDIQYLSHFVRLVKFFHMHKLNTIFKVIV